MCLPKEALTLILQASAKQHAPEDELAKEMTHDLEMNFNKIAPFGKEDTAKELQDHAAKTQDTLVDAVENAEVAEIKRAVFRALTRLRAATIKEFDTIARLETQAIDAYNDAHHYRAENPLTHLHEDEAPVETDGDVRPQAPTPQLDGSQEVILRCTSTYTEMRKGVAQGPLAARFRPSGSKIFVADNIARDGVDSQTVKQIQSKSKNTIDVPVPSVP